MPQWRENTRRARIETARTGMAGALQEMGSAVNAYFTPEERLGLCPLRRIQTQRHDAG